MSSGCYRIIQYRVTMGLLRLVQIFLVQILLGHHTSNGRCFQPAKVHVSCPPGWSQRELSCFKPIEEFTWLQARLECEKIGGVMATPHSQEDRVYFQNLTESESWINCNDLVTEGDWECVDGPANINNYWVSGEPNNLYGEQHCVKIWSQGWDDVLCDDTFPAVCKQPAHLQ